MTCDLQALGVQHIAETVNGTCRRQHIDLRFQASFDETGKMEYMRRPQAAACR